MRPSSKSSRRPDPTFYPVEETVGEDLLQRRIADLLRLLLERWFAVRKIRALVGADQFIYYRQYAPTVRVAPDIYVLPGVRPDARVPSWKTWETGIVPSFAFEIVSRNWEKDYVEAPERYAALGVSELVIFDPAPARHPDGLVWQVYRRVASRPLTRIDVSQGDRIRSKVLGCFLRTVGSDGSLRVRLATGPRGDDFFPSAEEAERAAKEVERAAKEAALADRDIALARVAELEATLPRRRTRKAR